MGSPSLYTHGGMALFEHYIQVKCIFKEVSWIVVTRWFFESVRPMMI